MRPLRFRLRTILILVATAGVLFGAEVARRRQKYLDGLAARYRATAERHYKWAMVHTGMIQQDSPERASFHISRVGYHVRLIQKYERAAAQPWKPVPFDPPPP